MAKKKKRKRKFTIPLAPVAAVAVVVAKPIQMAIDGDIEGAAAELGARIVGYNYQSGEFDLMYAAKNAWLPLIAGGLVHKIVGGSLGVNRMLGQAGVPIIRI